MGILSTVDEDEACDEDGSLMVNGNTSSMAHDGHQQSNHVSRSGTHVAQSFRAVVTCSVAFSKAEIPAATPLQQHFAIAPNFLELLLNLPMAHTFWQYAEPLHGLNAQRSKAQHRLSALSHGIKQAVNEACTLLSESELVSEVIGR